MPFYIKQIQYEAYTDPTAASIIVAETITADKWIGRYPDLIVSLKRTPHLYPYWAEIDPNALTKPETAFSDKWVGNYPNLISSFKRTPHLYPSVFFIQLAEVAETITADKWTGIYPNFIGAFKRTPHLYPSTQLISPLKNIFLTPMSKIQQLL